MIQPHHASEALRHFFSGTVQHVMHVEMGICDTRLADYLTDMLSKLIHVDDFYPFRDATGRRIRNLAEMVADADLGDDVPPRERDRAVHQHIGDFALFWTGVFPEGLRQLARVGAAHRLDDYLAQGKRSYAIASELVTQQNHPPAGVLRRLSDDFEFFMYGLNLCRQEWNGANDTSSAS